MKMLSNLNLVVEHYQEKIGTVKSAKEAMRKVACEVDKDGVFGVRDAPDVEDSRLYGVPYRACRSLPLTRPLEIGHRPRTC
jgi:hypothetical protein